jgi:mono/diheme cytochrome c family protein
VTGYVLGVNERQLNGSNTYPATGVTDNQIRTFNRLGLLNPAFNEAAIASYEYLSSVTNPSASLVQRARSYLDANCAQCHQPGGTGITFDARYDTPLTNQNIINAAAAFSLGYDHMDIVTPNDIWRSALYLRMDTTNAAIKMPPLARNLIDTNAVPVFEEWINSLGGTPTEPPPILTPASGLFTNFVTLTLQPADTNATLYYTLDGSLPTTNSTLYRGPFNLNTSAVVMANAFETGFVNSVAVSGVFTIVPPLDNLFAPAFVSGGAFEMQFWAPAGQTYILQGSADLLHWTSLSTNSPSSVPFFWTDPGATNFGRRFYRVIVP